MGEAFNLFVFAVATIQTFVILRDWWRRKQRRDLPYHWRIYDDYQRQRGEEQ